jgi:phosphate transport system permease protein
MTNLHLSKKEARSGPLADRIFGWVAKGAALVHAGYVDRHSGVAHHQRLAGHQQVWLRLSHQHHLGPVKEEFGGLVMIYGTLMTSLIALLIAVPVSFGIALFLTEFVTGLAQASVGYGH